jgi:hypothetical protein
MIGEKGLKRANPKSLIACFSWKGNNYVDRRGVSLPIRSRK